jgi:hypothetical protein
MFSAKKSPFGYDRLSAGILTYPQRDQAEQRLFRLNKPLAATYAWSKPWLGTSPEKNQKCR